MANVAYNAAKKMSNFAWATDTICVALVKSTFTVNIDHDFLSDTNIAGNELSGGNYVRKVLANKTVTVNDTNDNTEYDADDVTWTALQAAAGAAVGALFYKRVGADDTTPADDIPLFFMDFTVTGNGGDVVMRFSQSPSAVFTLG